MKSYILRDPKAVEPQIPPCYPLRPDPASPATVDAIYEPPAAQTRLYQRYKYLTGVGRKKK